MQEPDEPTKPEPADIEPMEAELTWAEEKAALQRAQEQRRLGQEKKDERQVWYFLAYFLFGIHILAFVMIYAVHHANK
ncbi:hypothetical protein OK074_0181 [Actinobacteria bacterium OK074]|nr:hypothetical protein OK074_0181 [Actinobacteria bacterium OK074]